MELLVKMVLGKKIEDSDIYDALYDICDREHSSCNSECPVYAANGNAVPDAVHDFNINRGCDCFRNGKAMAEFIRSHTR